MARKNRSELKNLFKNGLKPDEIAFVDIIDSSVNFTDDSITVNKGKVGINTTAPATAFHVEGGHSAVKKEKLLYQPPFMVGKGEGYNVTLNGNTIGASNRLAPSLLYMQPFGGDVHLYAGNADTNQIIIKDSGRIGVGIAKPAAALHIIPSGGIIKDVFDEVDEKGEELTDEEKKEAEKKAEEEKAAKEHELTDAERKAVAAKMTHDDDEVAKRAEEERVKRKMELADMMNDGGKRAGEPDPDLDPDLVDPGLIIGYSSGPNLSFSINSIAAKRRGKPSTLYLNPAGGNIEHGGSLIHTSDKSLKDNVKPLSKGLSEVLKLKPISFKWKKETGNEQDLKFGFIAQDVEKILKDIAYTNPKSGIKGISSIELIPVLVKSIQEQNKKIVDLEARMSKLEKLVQKK